MSAKVIRTVEAYSIHGFLAPGSEQEALLDYSEFFQELQAASPYLLRANIGDDLVAITEVHSDEEKLALLFVSGNPDDLPLVYDQGTGTAAANDPGEGRIVVRGAWTFVVPESRLVFLEKKRPGIPIFQVERFLARFGRETLGLEGLTISLNPVPSASFVAEVERFTRIREASLTLRRPNHSWLKSAYGLIGPAAESNASLVEIQLNADRGQSLAKDRGIVRELVDAVRNPINVLKNAVVKGTQPGFDGERSVSLSKHTVKGTARIDRGVPASESLVELANVVDLLKEQIEASSEDEGDS